MAVLILELSVRMRGMSMCVQRGGAVHWFGGRMVGVVKAVDNEAPLEVRDLVCGVTVWECYLVGGESSVFRGKCRYSVICVLAEADRMPPLCRFMGRVGAEESVSLGWMGCADDDACAWSSSIGCPAGC